MKKVNLLIALFFAFTINALAQPTIDWQRSIGGTRMDKINAVIRTSDNGYLVVGQTASISTQGIFDTMQAAIVRLNTEGGLVWQLNYGGTGTDIANSAVQLPTGGFAVVGESSSKDVLQNKGNTDAWIFTIDEKGTLIRQYSFGGAGNETFKNVLISPNNTITAIGTSNSNDGDLRTAGFKGNKDVLLARFSISEVLPISTRLFGGKLDDEGVSFVASSDTTFVITATTNSNDIEVSGNHGGGDIWVYEVGAGTIKWQRCLGGSKTETAADIIKNTAGYLIAGTTNSNEGDVKGLKGGTDIWAVQIDAKGTFLRQNCIGGTQNDVAAAIIADTVDKTSILIGSTTSKDGYVLSQHGLSDWAVVKIADTLKVRWHKCLGGSNTDYGCDIVQAKDGGLVAVGGAFSTDGNVANGEINGNGWIVKLNRKNISFYDDRQLIVRFRDGFTRDSAKIYQAFYKARLISNPEEDITCAGLMQLWQIDAFPVILPNGDTLRDIIEMAGVVKGKPEESSGDPNYAFSNGLDIDSIYGTPQFPTLQVYGQDSSTVLNTCQRVERDSALILAIIDSGIDSVGHALHQKYLWNNLKEVLGGAGDLDANGYRGDKFGWDFTGNDAYPYDSRGHGSHVTGIIGKMLERHRGDSVKLMILKIFDAEGNSSLYNLARALTYADCNGAQVVNMSLSYTSDTSKIASSVIKFLIDFGGRRNKMLAVAAAGNYNIDIDAPRATERYCPAYFTSENLLVVASVDPKKNRSSFSNYGRISVDVAAPGDNIFSTLNNLKWGFLSGTSMSAPFVSASAAMIGIKRCSNPFDYLSVRNALENTVALSTGLDTIRKKGFVNFCLARANFQNTLPVSCLVSVKALPSVFQRFSAKSNPFSSDLTVLVESSETNQAQLMVTDAIGKSVFSKNITIQAGENNIPIENENWNTGLYFISLKINGQVSTLKVVKGE
jgi:Subtilase family/Secretion system C-terminal sorting domain